ncbi:hypothetical protein O6P43_018381 [Quillaja saponaria]|uniref:Uncharacterized protein n=1 Tax=Quillaja saponaria TaxID=32244 RepID=A0AAD7LSB4_QUISA|nr:hypothetical protein O6P43_018381 [Quillaja saponaria]
MKNQQRIQNLMDEAPEVSKVSEGELISPANFHDKTSSSLFWCLQPISQNLSLESSLYSPALLDSILRETVATASEDKDDGAQVSPLRQCSKSTNVDDDSCLNLDPTLVVKCFLHSLFCLH